MKITYEEFKGDIIPIDCQILLALKNQAMELKDIVPLIKFTNISKKRCTPEETKIASRLQCLKKEGKVVCKKISNIWFWGVANK